MWSPLKGFLWNVPLKATRDKWRFRFWLRGVQCVSEVCCTPLRCASYCGDFLEMCSPCLQIYQLSPRCAAHRGANLVTEHLCKIETEFENTFACWVCTFCWKCWHSVDRQSPGHRGGDACGPSDLDNQKNRGLKSREALSLRDYRKYSNNWCWWMGIDFSSNSQLNWR